MASLRIGQLARAAGVSVDTVRFYERRGVLPRPARRASGYRVYTPAAITRLRAIKYLQGLGLTLDEIKGALAAVDAGEGGCQAQRWRLQAVLARVDAQLAALQRLRADIVGTLDGCEAGECALVERFAELGAGR